MGRALLISFGVTIVGTLFSMVVTILAAYGMSRSGSFGHRAILWIMMITMFFNGGIIPLFLVVSALGGYDQYWALIAPSAVSVFNLRVKRVMGIGGMQFRGGLAQTGLHPGLAIDKRRPPDSFGRAPEMEKAMPAMDEYDRAGLAGTSAASLSGLRQGAAVRPRSFRSPFPRPCRS